MLYWFSQLINNIIADKNTCDYIKLNKKIFNENKIKKKSIILVEFHNWHPLHIAFSIVTNFLSKKFSSKIVAYPGYLNISQKLKLDFKSKIKWHLGNFFELKNFGVYKSFGVDKIMYPIISKQLNEKGTKKAIYFFKKINKKNKILDIKVQNILIGDLIYDTYLKKFKKKTINIKDPNFFSFFKDSIILFYYWLEYFKKNNVNGVVISHAVYTLAIPARIAMNYNIKVFIANHSTIYNLTKKNRLSFNEFKYFKKKYSKLTTSVKNLGIKISKKRIKERFSGKVGVDMWYSKASSFDNAISKKRVLNNNNKLKVLIATHCLFDSPHVSGKFFFPDFFEWLEYLGKISNKYEYEWYLKSHPYFIKESYKKIREKIKKYPNIKIINPKTSHHQLLKEGIDIVLTCMGTIGFEYALFGKTVVNASINNPHFEYKFNVNPKNIEEYKKILSILPKYKRININKKEVYEYYFMMHIYHPKNWIFKNIENVEKKCGSYHAMYSSKIYKCFKDEYSFKNFNRINLIFENFYNSKNFKLEFNNMYDNFFRYVENTKLN